MHVLLANRLYKKTTLFMLKALFFWARIAFLSVYKHSLVTYCSTAMKIAIKIFINLFVLSLVASLSGCSKHLQIERDLQAYSERLQDFTDVSSQALTRPILLQDSLPPKTSLEYQLPPLQINLREFYAFSDCSLNTLVAQRNTGLGKMQLPSSRFLYETQLLSEFENCRALLFDDEESAKVLPKLAAWETEKRAQYPKVWSNFISQSNEISLHISVASDFIAGQAEDNFQSVKQAWVYIANTYNSQNSVDISASDLEYHLQSLEQSRLLARIFKTQDLIRRYLDATSPILETFLQVNPCSTPQQEEDVVIMRNIFTLFFAQKIQSVAGELNKYVYQLAPIIEKLTQVESLPQAYVDYLQRHLIHQHKAYKDSMHNHIVLWQSIFASCE